MSAPLFALLKYAATGLASSDMTVFDKLRARAMSGGFPVSTITGIPPLSFMADGTPLTSWSIFANMTQDGTPTAAVPVCPQEFGDFTESGEHAGEYAIGITTGGITQTIYLHEPLRKLGGIADEAASNGVVTRKIRKIVFDGTEDGWTLFSGNGAHQFYIGNALSGAPAVTGSSAVSNIAGYGATTATRADYQYGCYPISSGQGVAFQMYGAASDFPDVPAWKSYLAGMCANGTPVSAWYILAAPLEEAFEAPTIIPTTGSNTLSIETDLPPTLVSVTGHIE